VLTENLLDKTHIIRWDRSVLASISTVDVLAVVGAACSLLMVGGALYLLNRGIVTLKEASPDDAIKVEFQKVLSIQSRYPAIALFVVGVAFLCISFWFYQANPIRPMIVTGKLESDDPENATVIFTDALGQTAPTNGGQIRQQIWPKIDQILVEIATPGHEPGKLKALALVDKDQYELSFGTVKAGKKSVDAPAITVNPANVVPAPQNLVPPK
jgi:hypothetical protein